MSAIISVQLDRVEELAAELTALAVALAEEVPLCTSTARSLADSLGGDQGWWASLAGRRWAELAGTLAGRADAVATTLTSAVEAYRRADTLLAQRMGTGLPGATAIAR